MDNLGEVTICATTETGHRYFLIVHTVLGWTTVFEYGPAAPESDELPQSVSCSISSFEFSEKAIAKRIANFLAPKCRQVVDAEVVSAHSALDQCTDLVEYAKRNLT